MQCNVSGAHRFNVKSILVWGLIYLLMSRNEAYGYEKVIYYGLKRLFYHIFKELSTEQDDENSQECVCHSVYMSHLKYEHCRPCRILWPFMLAVLLEIFYRTAHKDTEKLKSPLKQQKEGK